jgi:type IV pilus assembly protein PilW
MNSGLRKQAGLSLVELMIALTLGLIILAGVGYIFLGSRQSYRLQDDQAHMQETGRYVLDVIGRSVRQAGWADLAQNNQSKVSFGGTPIAGSGTVITVQYDALGGELDCAGNAAAAGQIIQNSFNLDAANAQLRCDGKEGNPPAAAGNGVAIADNVEDLEILYGNDLDNDQAVNQYVVTPTNATITARICVLVRSDNTNVTNVAQRYLNCPGALGTVTGAAAFTAAADGRLRHAYVATFTIRNRVSNLP